MYIWDVIPVDRDGDMSIFTAIGFAVWGTATGLYVKFNQGCRTECQKDVQKKLNHHDHDITEIRERLASIEATTSSMLSLVEKLDANIAKIGEDLTDEARATQQAILRMLGNK